MIKNIFIYIKKLIRTSTIEIIFTDVHYTLSMGYY